MLRSRCDWIQHWCCDRVAITVFGVIVTGVNEKCKIVRWSIVSRYGTGRPPPQSVTASLPFLTPSEQVGAWHLLSLHTPDEQSEPRVGVPVETGSGLGSGVRCLQSPLEQPNVSPQGKQFPPQLPHICPPVQLNITSLSKVGAAWHQGRA